MMEKKTKLPSIGQTSSQASVARLLEFAVDDSRSPTPLAGRLNYSTDFRSRKTNGKKKGDAEARKSS